MSKSQYKVSPEQATKVAGWRAQIERANAAFAAALNVTKPGFEKPLKLSSSQEVSSELARFLSERYRTLRFTVSYEKGQQQVRAEPIAVQWPTDDDYSMFAHAQATIEVDPATYWPRFDVVEAYAAGFSSREQHLQELKVENARLKSSDPREERCFPFGPFGSWGDRRFYGR